MLYEAGSRVEINICNEWIPGYIYLCDDGSEANVECDVVESALHGAQLRLPIRNVRIMQNE